MITVLFVAATPWEQRIITQSIKTLHYPGIHPLFLTTGIGSYAMIGSLVAYLSQHAEIDFVVNIGICGYHPEYALNAPLIQVGHIRSGSNQKEEIPLLPFRFAPLGSFYSSEREVRSLE